LCILESLYQGDAEEQYERVFLIHKKNSSVTRVSRLRAGKLKKVGFDFLQGQRSVLFSTAS
jgi:hypothetical protein